MADPVFVTIGGERFELPPILNFACLERVWPAMKARDACPADDIVGRTAANLAIVAGALLKTKPAMTLPVLKEKLGAAIFTVDSPEMFGLTESVNQLLLQSGLIKVDAPAAGEPKAGEDDAPETPAQT
nr:hypothetical protein [uncultured Rhodopila sp.]